MKRDLLLFCLIAALLVLSACAPEPEPAAEPERLLRPKRLLRPSPPPPTLAGPGRATGDPARTTATM